MERCNNSGVETKMNSPQLEDFVAGFTLFTSGDSYVHLEQMYT